MDGAQNIEVRCCEKTCLGLWRPVRAALASLRVGAAYPGVGKDWRTVETVPFARSEKEKGLAGGEAQFGTREVCDESIGFVNIYLLRSYCEGRIFERRTREKHLARGGQGFEAFFRG